MRGAVAGFGDRVRDRPLKRVANVALTEGEKTVEHLDFVVEDAPHVGHDVYLPFRVCRTEVRGITLVRFAIGATENQEPAGGL